MAGSVCSSVTVGLMVVGACEVEEGGREGRKEARWSKMEESSLTDCILQTNDLEWIINMLKSNTQDKKRDGGEKKIKPSRHMGDKLG